MSCHRTIVRLSAVLAVVALAKGCGDGESPSAPPTPEPARPTTVTVSPATDELTALGQAIQLTAEVRDQNARVMAGATVTWRSSAISVATVDASGLVTAAGNGEATVTASAGEASGSAVVTVMQSVASVVVSQSTETIGLGSTLQLTAEGFDENGNAVEGAEFSWESSDTAIATVDALGLVTGVAVGVVTITASAGSGQGTAEITVMDLERAALVALHEATDGPNWVDAENWLTDAPLGEWYGVDTDASGRLVRLDLGGRWDSDAREWIPHGLSGPIPAELGNLTSLTRLHLDHNFLSGPIPPELGRLPNLTSLNLESNDLSGPIPTELGGLPNLTSLDLGFNNLTGPIPAELGNLYNLRSLNLQNNSLTGSLPRSFLDLSELTWFIFIGNEGLCAPGIAGFADWLEAKRRYEGRFCNESDTGVLESLFEATGGGGWTNAEGWLGGPALAVWHGVSADSLGRVTALDLTRNGLTGELPAKLGSLAEMTTLRVSGNALSGRLPISLSQLPLVDLHYTDTGLCPPADASFRTWLDGIASHEGTGVECDPLSDREILVALHEATGGPNWTNADNWLTDAPLGAWHGVRTDASGRVDKLNLVRNNLTGSMPPELGSLASLEVLEIDVPGPIPPELGNLAKLRLLFLGANGLSGPIPPELGNLARVEIMDLSINGLSGPIPPEFGNLASLTRLNLRSNNLSGPIPPELGDLASLSELWLWDNNLTGSIPPELGRLTSLTELYFANNDLTGSIPAELGNLAGLKWMFLFGNDLTGPIPPELGELASLKWMWLSSNSLTGPIPTELGSLADLESLFLGGNDLTGPIPPEMGGMSSLRRLSLTNNPGMEGALPAELTSLQQLEALLAGDTGLCASADPGIQAWLARVHKRRIKPCAEGDPPMAYLTQAVQSREYPVPLVAGERALLRVFPTARQATSVGIPAARARFYVNGRETHVENIPGKSAPIPTEVDESSLSKSANAEIPGHLMQPGLEMMIEVDPDRTLDPALGVARRIPETGRLAVDVRAMPLFDLTLVPFIWTKTRDYSIVDLIAEMAADPENHEMLGETRTLLPVGDLDVKAHEPVLSSSRNAFAISEETKAIRAMEGGSGHYMGMMAWPVTGARGVAFLPGRSSFSIPVAEIMAHELGHNMNLQHAPCRTTGEPSYPYPDGSIGVWGYNFRDGGSLVHPARPDLMSYCFVDQWISDYSFTNALVYRLFDEGPPAAAIAASSKSLFLWGGISADSVPFLEPAFVVDAPAALPDSAGEYRVTGRTTSGDELFSLSFTMPEVADGDGSSSFAFVIPVRSGWEGNLASITLSGPGGSATLDSDTDLSMAILLDPSTGQVRGILRDLPQADRAAALAPQADLDSLDVLFSRGIPDASAWGR